MKLRTLTIGILAFSALLMTSCKKEGCIDVNANNYNAEAEKDDESCTYPVINMNGTGTSGDITGSGGTANSSTTFTQNSATLGWDMAQDATSGSFNLTVTDANGAEVINNTLTAGSGGQDDSGTSSAGATGTWTATVTLTNFSGTGDYSFQ
ncbi:MAG: hypothetical protein BM555_03185 [Crocinitomix sp. MedPE-SWsnd]|nr:MAG: hypothetical protein BM555_03185 [Crocinitomix sp. MedPE-SWsnd]